MFDPTTWQDPTTDAPSSKIPEVIQNLRKLSTLLRDEEVWRRKWRWDFGSIRVRDSASGFICGSAGCALGLWDFHYGQSSNSLHGVAFDSLMDHNDFHHIFISGSGRPHGIAPSTVADRIDQYIASQGF